MSSRRLRAEHLVGLVAVACAACSAHVRSDGAALDVVVSFAPAAPQVTRVAVAAGAGTTQDLARGAADATWRGRLAVRPGAQTVWASAYAGGRVAATGTAQATVPASGVATVTITLDVSHAPAPPTIMRFEASPASIVAGQGATLGWDVFGADTLAITPGVGTVSGTSRAVSPTSTTTFTLAATNAGGTRTAQATVWVSTGGGTDVPGGTVSGHWTTAGSPYRVHGDLTVPSGSVLVIDPGVRVIFQGPYYLRLLGGCQAVGTALAPIQFTTTDADVARGSGWVGWRGIRISGNAFTAPDHDHGAGLYDFRFCEIAYVDKTVLGTPGDPWEDWEGSFFASDVWVGDLVFEDNWVHHGRLYLLEITHSESDPAPAGTALQLRRNVFENGTNGGLVASHTRSYVHLVGGAVRHGARSTEPATVAYGYDVPLYLDGVEITDCGDQAAAPWFAVSSGLGAVNWTPP